MSWRNALSEIDHRLAVIESIAPPAELIERANARLNAIAGLQAGVVDLELLAANIQRVAEATANRLAATERHLSEVSQQLARSSGSA